MRKAKVEWLMCVEMTIYVKHKSFSSEIVSWIKHKVDFHFWPDMYSLNTTTELRNVENTIVLRKKLGKKTSSFFFYLVMDNAKKWQI